MLSSLSPLAISRMLLMGIMATLSRQKSLTWMSILGLLILEQVLQKLCASVAVTAALSKFEHGHSIQLKIL